jgi:hypothetical protein
MLIPVTNAKARDEIYAILVNAIECGPFDGGCLVFARALQIRLGGEIWVLVSAKGAEHAVLKLGGLLIDADGAMPPSEKLLEFSQNELVTTKDSRPFRDGDLTEAPQDEDLAGRISQKLSKTFMSKIEAEAGIGRKLRPSNPR